MIINGIGTDKDGNTIIVEDILKGKSDKINIKEIPYITWNEKKASINDSPKNILSSLDNVYKELQKKYPELFQCQKDNYNCIIQDVLKKSINDESSKKEISNVISDLKTLCWIKIEKESLPDLTSNGIMLHEPASTSTPRTVISGLIKRRLSVHFIIDGNSGYIYSCLPLFTKAAHCGTCTKPYSKDYCSDCEFWNEQIILQKVDIQKIYNDAKTFTEDKKDPEKNKRMLKYLEDASIKYLKEQNLYDIENKKIKESYEGPNIKIFPIITEKYDKEKNKYIYKESPQGCYKIRHPAQSLNSTKISIEICQASNVQNYEKKTIPAAVDLCAWLSYLYNFNPVGPEKNDSTLVSQKIDRTKTDEYNSNSGDNLFDLDKNTTKTILTHREGHIFYRKASNHVDPDKYWNASNYLTKEYEEAEKNLKEAEKNLKEAKKNLKEAKKKKDNNKAIQECKKKFEECKKKFEECEKKFEEVKVPIKITKEMLNEIGLNEDHDLLDKQLVPKYFRLLVNEKLKLIESLGNDKKQIINKYCNPMLLLLIPDSIKAQYQEKTTQQQPL